MSVAWHIDRVLALAGLYQATSLVQRIAREGTVESDPFAASIGSVLTLEAPSTASLFGGLPGLGHGLGVLQRQLERRERDLELTRYAVCLLLLQRRFVRRQDLVEKVRAGLVEVSAQAEYFSPTHETVIARLGELYAQTVSTLTPRIMVTGAPEHLKSPYNAERIRALLLAGLRATVLWRQLGGTRWQLLLARGRIARSAGALLEEARA